MTDQLAALRDEWWRELRAEIPMQLHVDDGESMAEGSAGRAVKRQTNGYPATWTGMPFDRHFERYIDGEHGGDFVATDAFTAVRDWCRREHWRESHVGDNPFGWTACSRVSILYVRLRWSVTTIAEYLDLDAWLVRRLLIDALEWADRWRADRRTGVEIADESHKQLNESEALSVVLAYQHNVVYEEKVWNALRSEAWCDCDCGGALRWLGPAGDKHPVEVHAFMLSWDDELKRRRAFHAVHCHERCALLMAVAA